MVALEYKVVEFEVDLPYPPDFDPHPNSDDDEDDQSHEMIKTVSGFDHIYTARPHGVTFKTFGNGGKIETPQTQEAQEAQEKARQERAIFRLNEARRVLKNMKLEALRQCREFQTTKLKELGEDGWTLQSIDCVNLKDHRLFNEQDMKFQPNESWTNLYYFSRPL